MIVRSYHPHGIPPQILCLLKRGDMVQEVEHLDVLLGVSAREWSDTTVEEMKVFIGILILMGIQKLPRLEMYWSTQYSVIHTPGIADIMPRVRFEQLFRCLQMCSSGQSIPVRTRSFVQGQEVARFENQYNKHQHCTIDEAMIKSKAA